MFHHKPRGFTSFLKQQVSELMSTINMQQSVLTEAELRANEYNSNRNNNNWIRFYSSR